MLNPTSTAKIVMTGWRWTARPITSGMTIWSSIWRTTIYTARTTMVVSVPRVEKATVPANAAAIIGPTSGMISRKPLRTARVSA